MTPKLPHYLLCKFSQLWYNEQENGDTEVDV